MVFNWDNEKNERLKKARGVSFEQIVVAVEADDMIDILEHPNPDRYPDQIVILVRINDYIYAVPAVVKKDEFFLKTIYPSRKYTDVYLPGKRKGGA
jgi:uncharacterized DUF497 family protein